MYLDLCIIVHVLCTIVQWLEKDFLPYLENWEKWTQSVPNLTATQQNNMLLSAETRLGLKITCKYCMYTCRLYTCKQWWPFSIHTHVGKSFIEVVRYLFTVPGVTSFLSQRICQDPLENFFGCQRQRGGVHDNPNVQEFVKNTQALRVINSFCKGPSRGNCRGGLKLVSNSRVTDQENEPLPKRRKTKSHS